MTTLNDAAKCDAFQFGAVPTILIHGDGTRQCRCLVCSRCGHHTGNSTQGHYWAACKASGTLRDFHFCCPDEEHGCEIEEREKLNKALEEM